MVAANMDNNYLFNTNALAHERLLFLQKIHGPDSIRFLTHSGLKPGMRVLDIGCGIGLMSCWLAKQVGAKGRIIAVDKYPAQLDAAKLIAQQEKINNIDFMQLDVIDLDKQIQDIDLVYSRYLLSHLPDANLAIKAMLNTLKPGGILVLEDVNHHQFFHYPPHSAFDKAMNLFMQAGKNRGVDYTIGDKLFTLLKAYPLTDFQVQAVQPLAANAQDKQMIVYLTQECAEKYITDKLITAVELEALIAELNHLIRDDSALLGYTRTIQLRAIYTPDAIPRNSV